MRKLGLSVLWVLVVLAVSGCNTVKGVGQDLEAMGRSMQAAGE